MSDEVVIFNALGRTEYEDGEQVVQVFDGEGQPPFERKYWQAISETNWFLKMLDEEPKTKALGEFADRISLLKKAMEAGYGHERTIVKTIQKIRWLIKTLVAPHDPANDLRRCACHTEMRWKCDTDYKFITDDD